MGFFKPKHKCHRTWTACSSAVFSIGIAIRILFNLGRTLILLVWFLLPPFSDQDSRRRQLWKWWDVYPQVDTHAGELKHMFWEEWLLTLAPGTSVLLRHASVSRLGLIITAASVTGEWWANHSWLVVYVVYFDNDSNFLGTLQGA